MEPLALQEGLGSGGCCSPDQWLALLNLLLLRMILIHGKHREQLLTTECLSPASSAQVFADWQIEKTHSCGFLHCPD